MLVFFFWLFLSVVVAHAFSPSTSENVEAGKSLSLRPAWSIEREPGQPGLHRKPCLEKLKGKKTTQEN